MNRRLLTLISSVVLANILFIGGGTYALLTASTTNSGNQFGTFQAESIDIESSPTEGTNTSLRSFALTANCSRQTVQFPMFYGYADYPTGSNPYDVKTFSSPSGEIPGGWASGDQVKRVWNIWNKGDGSKITEIYATNFHLSKDGQPITSGETYNDFLNHMRIAVYYPTDSAEPVYSDSLSKMVDAPQLLNQVICLNKCWKTQIAFVASMDRDAGNDLQGVKGVVDFQIGAEQTKNNCFDPPFSNWDYSMKSRSTTPIKFECYDSDGDFIDYCQDVKLVINGGGFTHTYTLGNDLSCNGGHYQANVDGSPFSDGIMYNATIYVDGQRYCSKTFTTEPGSRSNAH